ncbi:hypothetical protein [Mycobacterium colombiense]
MSVESLTIYRYKAARPEYHYVFDFQWVKPDGRPAGRRSAVPHDHGLRGDVIVLAEKFGDIVLRRVGDNDFGEIEFRAELRTGGHAYELPIVNGDE